MDRIDKNNFFWMLMIMLFCMLIASLSGCAVSPTGVGNAQYHYRNGECEVTVNSARELSQANVQITSDCQVTVTSAKVSNDTAYLGVIQSLAGALR